MKISLFVIPSDWGGAENHTIGLARMLQTRGHEVTLVEMGNRVYLPERIGPEPNINLVHVDLPRFYREVSHREWRALLAPFRGDLAILGKTWFFTGSAGFDFAARRQFRRYVTIEHGLGPEMPPKSSRRYLFNTIPGPGLWWYKQLWPLYRRSIAPHRIVCVSNAVRRRLVEDLRFPARKVFAVCNGIDPQSRFVPSAQHREQTRAAWGIPADAFVFGTVGRLHAVKQYDVAIRSFAELVAQTKRQDVHLVLVGEGPLDGQLRELAVQSGLNGQVHFQGFVSKPWEVYPGLDALLIPSQSEGLPLNMLEGMGCGCCAIAYAVAGIPEVITDRRDGWLVAPGEQSQYREAMKEALQLPPEAAAEMRQRARERILRAFDAQKQFALLAELIEQA